MACEEMKDAPPHEDIDIIKEAEEEKKEESEKEKAKREKEELKTKLKEYGGAVSWSKLISMGTCNEKLLLFIGMFGAAVNGVGQVAIQWFFGGSMDGLGKNIVVKEKIKYYDNNPSQLTPQIQAMLDIELADANDELLETMYEVAYTMLAFATIIGFFSFFYAFAFRWFAEKSQQRIRPMYFDALLHRDIGWFDTHDPAGLATEMNGELEAFGEGLGQKFALVFQGVAMFIGGFVISFFKSWKLSLVMLGAMPFMLIGMLIMGKAAQDILEEKQGAYGKAASVMDECLYAIRTVVTFGGERKELKRYEEAIESARKSGVINRTKIGAGTGWFMGLGMMGTLALAFWFANKMMQDAKTADPDDPLYAQDVTLTSGDVMVAFGSLLMGTFALGSMAPGSMASVAAKQAMSRFFYIRDNESEIQRRGIDSREDLGSPVQTFELKDVHFSYPARPDVKVLQGVSLTIKQGQKVAFVGESGSGKSTIMSLLERFYDPTAGTVLVNGKDFRTLSIRSVRKSIGYVGQEPVLFATTVEKNIKMSNPDATTEEVKNCASMAKMDFVDKLPEGLKTYVGTGGSQFSGGQKQRIAIARALLMKPTVLFLDEATSALDSKSERQIQDTIDSVAQSSVGGGMTIVSIAHRLSTVQNCDVIYVLSLGAVVEYGTHSELMQKESGLYQALAAAQNITLEGDAGDNNSKLNRQISESGDAIKKRTSSGTELVKKNADEAEKEREKAILKEFNTKGAFSRLIGFVKRESWQIPLGCLCAGASGMAMPIMGGVVMMDAMSGMIAENNDKVQEACILFAILGAGKWVTMIFQFALFGNIGEWMTKRARMGIITSIMSQEIGFHDNPDHTPGQLSGLMSLSSSRIARLLISIGDSSDAISTLLCGVILAFFLSWQFSLALLVAMPGLAVINSIEMKNQMAMAEGQSENVKASAQILQDALTNAKTVQACGNEKELVKLYEEVLAPSYVGVTKKHLIGGFSSGMSQFYLFAFMAGAFVFMAHLIVGDTFLGESHFEDVFGCFMALLYGVMGVGMAFAVTGDLGKAKVAAHDVFQIIDRKSQIDGLNPIGQEYPNLPELGRFEFENVQFHYPFRPDVEVLKGMSFIIEAGTSVGVVGPSGGGKSTVMAMIQRFYDPQSGTVSIGASASKVALSTVNIRWWRKQIGFVGQEPILFRGSVLENVKYGLEEDESVSEEHLEKCKQDSFLTFLDNQTSQGWQTEVGVRGGRLSGGQKQRVAICRALVRNPKVILLDEATSALDSQSEKVVGRALERARAGRTSFAIAHRLSTIQDSDVIIVVSDGKIVEQGSHAELIAKEAVYFKLHQSQGVH